MDVKNRAEKRLSGVCVDTDKPARKRLVPCILCRPLDPMEIRRVECGICKGNLFVEEN